MSAFTLTVLAHVGVCALVCLAGPVTVSSGPETHVVSVAVLQTHHTEMYKKLPKLHMAYPASVHVIVPVLPRLSSASVAVPHAAGGGSISLPQRKPHTVKIMQDYPARVSLALARVKRYPLSERIAHHQGRVWLSLQIAADGRLLAVTLRRTSGVASLDRVALAMAHHAAPFPPVPGGKAILISVPVTFSLNV